MSPPRFSLVLVTGLCATALASCGSLAHAAVGTQSTCSTVGAVLANGPDPGVDPVGYAQAQILPLRALKVGNATLRADLATLESAFGAEVATNGSAAARRSVATAIARLDVRCPGAAR